MELERITRKLSAQVAKLSFAAPVTHVYAPLTYAWAVHQAYLRRFGPRTGRVLLVGMNPGPWGMAQTGVPFGDPEFVRDWMGLEAPVARPAREHPRRQVAGLASRRGEVSGRRLWGWARERYGSADAFFRRFFVLNYCPLAFLEETGRNRTPDRLPAAEREPLFTACDSALGRLVTALRPKQVVGIGRFAEARCGAALAGRSFPIGWAPHPSPASPAANRGWARRMDAALAGLGVVPEG